MAGEEGFEPPNAWTKTMCLTTWRLPSVTLRLLCVKPPGDKVLVRHGLFVYDSLSLRQPCALPLGRILSNRLILQNVARW